jgi:hypothetical protein
MWNSIKTSQWLLEQLQEENRNNKHKELPGCGEKDVFQNQ